MKIVVFNDRMLSLPGSMQISLKPALSVALIAASSFSLLVAQPSDAAAKRRPAARGGGGGGGVMLQTPNPNTPIEHNNRAVELGSKGLWPDAIREHETALQMDPNNKEFRTNLSAAQLRYGDLLFAKHDYYNAIKQYRGALYVDPNNAPADAHLDECLRAIKKNPDEIKVRRGIGEDADVSGDYETAIVEYRKCVKMSDDGPNHARLGRVLLKAGKVVDGFSELKIAVGKTWETKDKAIALDLGSTHRQLGDILKEFALKANEDGRKSTAIKRMMNAGIEYRRALTLNPSDADSARSLIELARGAVAMNPSFDNHMMLGGAYQLASDFEHAKMEYEDCWKINPNSATLPIARKSFYLAVVKSPLTSPAMLAQTTQKIQDSLQKSPGDPELLYLYGRAKESAGDKQAALSAYQQAAAINAFVNPDLKQGISRLGGGGEPAPGTPRAPGKTAIAAVPDDTAKNLMKYGEIESKIRGGDLDAATKDLMSIVEKNAKEGHAWLLLGNVYEKQGNTDQAAVAYRQASYLKEKDADSALRQIDSSRAAPLIEEYEKYIKEDNPVKAAAALRQAASIAPNLSSIHRKLADVLRKLGDNKEADKELKKAAELDK
jgi:tetratricopeptide (TPR) repeat protein